MMGAASLLSVFRCLHVVLAGAVALGAVVLVAGLAGCAAVTECWSTVSVRYAGMSSQKGIGRNV